MTHLRRTGTTVRAKGLLTEYDFSNQRRNYSKQIRNINKNVINILSKTLAEKGCSTIHADIFIVKTTVERRV
jgi:hypothetical protein